MEPLEPDPVIEVYKRDLDRTLYRRNLQLTPEERILQAQQLLDLALELRRAKREALNKQDA